MGQIFFPRGLPGFYQEKHWTLYELAKPFYLLEASGRSEIALPVVSPYVFYPEYKVSIAPDVLKRLSEGRSTKGQGADIGQGPADSSAVGEVLIAQHPATDHHIDHYTDQHADEYTDHYTDYHTDEMVLDAHHLEDHPNPWVVLVVVTLRKPLEASTMNLKAPIILNSYTRQAEQVVLEQSPYDTRAPLNPLKIQDFPASGMDHGETR